MKHLLLLMVMVLVQNADARGGASGRKPSSARKPASQQKIPPDLCDDSKNSATSRATKLYTLKIKQQANDVKGDLAQILQHEGLCEQQDQ